ncbi:MULTISPECIES: mycothiol transferase [unclassified Isoptericola]|uniref:mycothiol transferase n=1 Tax=unclassified Isoptericola TaxID=2623355 RepID=UPI0036676593
MTAPSAPHVALLTDAFERIVGEGRRVLRGASAQVLGYRPVPEANTVAWLVWHLTRVQDDHVADVAGVEQRWTAGGWAEKFGLAFDVADTGYGHTPEQVAAVRADAATLRGYLDDVHAATTSYLTTVTAADLERVVDTRWDPPVTLGVRLVSVVGDDLQHVGQAAYVRGLAERAGA